MVIYVWEHMWAAKKIKQNKKKAESFSPVRVWRWLTWRPGGMNFPLDSCEKRLWHVCWEPPSITTASHFCRAAVVCHPISDSLPTWIAVAGERMKNVSRTNWLTVGAAAAAPATIWECLVELSEEAFLQEANGINQIERTPSHLRKWCAKIVTMFRFFFPSPPPPSSYEHAIAVPHHSVRPPFVPAWNGRRKRSRRQV